MEALFYIWNRIGSFPIFPKGDYAFHASDALGFRLFKARQGVKEENAIFVLIWISYLLSGGRGMVMEIDTMHELSTAIFLAGYIAIFIFLILQVF